MLLKFGTSNFTKLIVFSQILMLGLFFIFLVYFVPRLEYPLNGEVLDSKGVHFDFKHANAILIDDNEDFSSPKLITSSELERGEVVFEPGVYYWKAKGVIDSLSREFTVPSTVGLEFENSTLKNTGDVDLEVEVNKTFATGLVILEINSERQIEDKGLINIKGAQL